MALSRIVAICTLENITPYSQSKKHEEPHLEGESHEDYSRRTFRSHLHVENGTVHIPATAIHKALAAAAKYSKKKIPNQRGASWTPKFEAGIALFNNIDLGVKPEDVDFDDIYANLDGIQGSAKRGLRRYPTIRIWTATFEVQILDPIITRDIFEEMMEQAGIFIGIGRWAPPKGGQYGRFRMTKLEWVADRQPAMVRQKEAA